MGVGFFASVKHTDGRFVAMRILVEKTPAPPAAARRRGTTASAPTAREVAQRLEPVTHFLENKAVLCKYMWASRLGCERRKLLTRAVTRAMSLMKNGRFALRI